MVTIKEVNKRYTAMFVPPVSPSKAWTTTIKFFSADYVITLEKA